jgi:hypothetical protein
MLDSIHKTQSGEERDPIERTIDVLSHKTFQELE